MSHFVLRKTSILVSSLYLGLIGHAFAAESVEKQMTIDSKTQVQIKVQRGEINIESWNKNDVSVTGTLDERSEGLVFEHKGNNLYIEDKMPRSYKGGDNGGSKLTIKVPKSVKLGADTISANLQLAGVEGELDINTVSGNIKADNLAGSPNLHTVSGDITTKALSGNVMLDTVSGEIKDTQSQGEIKYRLVSGDLDSQTLAEKVRVEQVSGEISGDFKAATQINIRTVSGDTQVSLAKNIERTSIESVSGDVNASFAELPDASFDLNGGPGGKITNGLTQDLPQKQKYVPSESLSFQTGAGSGDVLMHTISGNLILSLQGAGTANVDVELKQD